MLHISSLQNPTIKLIRSLSDKKARKAHGLFVAEGRKVLERARLEGWEPDYVIGTRAPEAWGKAQLMTVDLAVMAALSAQNNPHEELAVFRQRHPEQAVPHGVWLALEDIRDPGNLGTIIRTADAAGASGIILAGNTCDPWGADCVRATMGSIFGVALAKFTAAQLHGLLREWPGESVATFMSAPTDYRRPYQRPTLLLMGSESSGLSEATAALCSTRVSIPMTARVESLNVASASALLLYAALHG